MQFTHTSLAINDSIAIVALGNSELEKYAQHPKVFWEIAGDPLKEKRWCNWWNEVKHPVP